ncbi:MAG: tetratricopeptide repeat protein, partial [Chthoniobacterales bacterium]
MAVKIERELSEAQHGHFLRAVAAIELKNLDYAISLLQGILKQEPEFLMGRQLLRRAEVTRSKAIRKSVFNVSSAPLAVMKAQRELKKNPKLASELVEKFLEQEPYHRQANLLLKDAALAAGWPETAVFALQTLLEDTARDTKILHELGRVYHQMNENDEAVAIYNRIMEIDPSDAEAARLGKDAAARASMTTGGWTKAESYRELIKDKDVAVSLEQQNRMTPRGDALEQQIAEAFEYHEAEPQNVGFAKRLGLLHEQKEVIETAIEWYEYAAKLTTGTDPELARRIAALTSGQVSREIAELEEFLATHKQDDELYAQKGARLEAVRKKQVDGLIEQ